MNIDVKVLSRTLDSTTLQWRITEWAPDATKLRVLRSESRFGPYDPICDWFQATDSDTFTDTTHQHKITRRWYYQIETNNDLIFPTPYGASTERRSDTEARLKASENELLYRKHGQAVIYYPCRSYGTRCPKCFDKVMNKQTLANCDACYSTTYSGGFLYPIRCWVMIENIQVTNNRDSGPGVPVITKRASARLPWFLDAKVGDVIIDEDNARWKVGEPLSSIQKRGVVLYITCQLTQITLDCVEYSLPVPEVIDSPTRSWKYTPDFLR